MASKIKSSHGVEDGTKSYLDALKIAVILFPTTLLQSKGTFDRFCFKKLRLGWRQVLSSCTVDLCMVEMMIGT